MTQTVIDRGSTSARRAFIGHNAKNQAVRLAYRPAGDELICWWSGRARLPVVLILALMTFTIYTLLWRYTGFDPFRMMAALRRDWFGAGSLGLWAIALPVILLHQLLYKVQVRFCFKAGVIELAVRHFWRRTRTAWPLSQVDAFEILPVLRQYHDSAPANPCNTFEAFVLVARLADGQAVALMETTDQRILMQIVDHLASHDATRHAVRGAIGSMAASSA